MKPVAIAALRAALLGLAILLGSALSIGNLTAPAAADNPPGMERLKLPPMDSKRGRLLYVSKACVGCHAINGIGGTSAAPLDAATMDPSGNPFEFFARMWLGTKPMIDMQVDRMGQQVEVTAQELGDIVAFIHDAEQQKTFSISEIPDNIEDIIDAE